MSSVGDLRGGFSLGGLMNLDVDSLDRNTTLTILDLGYEELQNNVVMAVVASLGRNTTLTTVRLAGNGIGEVGGVVLAASLEEHNTHNTVS